MTEDECDFVVKSRRVAKSGLVAFVSFASSLLSCRHVLFEARADVAVNHGSDLGGLNAADNNVDYFNPVEFVR